MYLQFVIRGFTTMTTGEIIKYNREKKKLTINELAYILHTDTRVIREIESNKRYLKIHDLTLLAKIFDISVDSLITDKEISLLSTGKRLRHFRIKAGLSQRELAEILGVDPTYISAVERERRLLKAKLVSGICRILSVDEEELINSSNCISNITPKEFNNIGEKIKYYRKANNYSIRTLSEATGIPIGRLRAVESGKHIPYISDIDLITKHFAIPNIKSDINLKIKDFKLPELVKYYRINKGWTQEELAKGTDLSITTIAQIEQGNKNYLDGTIKKVASALNIREELIKPFYHKKALAREYFIDNYNRRIIENTTQITLAEHIRYYRLIKRLTIKELAEEVGVVLSTIANIEHGRSMPRKQTMVKIAEVLGIDESLYQKYLV